MKSMKWPLYRIIAGSQTIGKKWGKNNREREKKSKMAAIVGLGERNISVIKIVYFNPDVIYKE